MANNVDKAIQQSLFPEQFRGTFTEPSKLGCVWGPGAFGCNLRFYAGFRKESSRYLVGQVSSCIIYFPPLGFDCVSSTFPTGFMEAFHSLRTIVPSLQYYEIIAYVIIVIFLYVNSHN